MMKIYNFVFCDHVNVWTVDWFVEKLQGTHKGIKTGKNSKIYWLALGQIVLLCKNNMSYLIVQTR